METEKFNSREGAESRESKEGEVDKELQAAAAMERADVMIREVKSSKKQMQNIVRHMQEVQQAIQALRQQLQLVQSDDEDASVEKDKEQIEKLKKKISGFVGELEKMRTDLVREQMEELSQGAGVGMSTDELQKKAEEMVEELIAQAKN